MEELASQIAWTPDFPGIILIVYPVNKNFNINKIIFVVLAKF